MSEEVIMQNGFYLGEPGWIPWVIAIGVFLAIATFFSYRRSPMPPGKRTAAILLRLVGIGLLLLCLLEPMGSEERAKPQSNAFALLVDNSQSTREDWRAHGRKNGDLDNELWYRDAFRNDAEWGTKLADSFRLRRYLFDNSLTAIDSFEGMEQEGTESALVRALTSLRDRYHLEKLEGKSPSGEPADENSSNERTPSTPSERTPSGQPLAGILLFSDGQATDRETWSSITHYPIPVYPVVRSVRHQEKDLAIHQLIAQQSDFETAPITLIATVQHRGYSGKEVDLHLRDKSKTILESKRISLPEDSESVQVEFRFRPKEIGVQGYEVTVAEASKEGGENDSQKSTEWTLHNNSRHQVVDRGRGPYRILYIAGRPNWEYKFLSRALSEDQEIELTGLIRIAKKEAKFNFRDTRVDSSNPLFSGFEDVSEEEKEQYDEPVYVRLGVKESGELQKGFPKELTELFQYKAIVIDDVEHDFFTQEQQSMLRQFVAVRGGGLIALGGQEAMRGEGFGTSALSQMLPVYGDPTGALDIDWTVDPNSVPIESIRLGLTRDGWLQPFMRLSDNEAGERSRLEKMPSFQVWNQIRSVKPGASVLANASVEGSEEPIPILVTQRFGRGRTAALLVGDWWRWAMHREGREPAPLYQAWRQLIRWLITDVPKSLTMEATMFPESSRARKLLIDVRGDDYKAVDNATIAITVASPDGQTIELVGEPSLETPGRYEAIVLCEQEGVYIAEAHCSAPDGSSLGSVHCGWVNDPMAVEFQGIGEDETFLKQIAESSGGRLIRWEELNSFVDNIPSEQIPIKERKVYPLWHQSWVLVTAIACLCLEWGWRRRYGMA